MRKNHQLGVDIQLVRPTLQGTPFEWRLRLNATRRGDLALQPKKHGMNRQFPSVCCGVRDTGSEH